MTAKTYRPAHGGRPGRMLAVGRWPLNLTLDQMSRMVISAKACRFPTHSEVGRFHDIMANRVDARGCQFNRITCP